MPVLFDDFIDIEPVPKGRPRVSSGRTYTPARTAQFEEAVRWSLKAKRARPTELGELRVDLGLLVRKGKIKGDADNYVKACLDAGNQRLWIDDKQIREIHATLDETIDNPGFTIRVSTRDEFALVPAVPA